jgi:WD40 repeat protein
MPTRLFLSYSRSDDEPFVWRLCEGLKAAGFEVWFDRVSMPSRELSFSQEIEDAIMAHDRLVLVVGPGAAASDYVTHEWRFAFHQAVKCVNPIVRLNGADAAGKPIDGYDLIPEDLRGPHAEDFRDDAQFDLHFENLVRQLSDPLPPIGKLVAVPDLPPNYIEQRDRLANLRDMLLADLRKPVVVTGDAGRVGLQGMGGIGKSVLACALAHRPEIRRAFPDGVLWVTLGQKPDVVDLQRKLVKAGFGQEPDFTSEQTGKERLREMLKERAALVVLDDGWDRAHAEAFNVIGPRCRLLLTTRDAGLVTALAAQENHYQVQLPTLAEARAILAKAAGIENPDALPPEAGRVVEQCDRLPLALALCGGMVHGGTPWADLVEALREHDLQFLSDAHPGEEQHANVWKAIDVGVRVLPEGERRRFAELAVFALDTGAPEAAVETLWEHTAGLKPRYARDLLRTFSERSLVRLDAAAGRMTLHDLVHDFASGMAGDPAALDRVLLDAYRKKCPDGWASGPNDGYFLEKLCTHLVAAGQAEDAAALLGSARWGLVKCGAGLVFSLDRDYGEVAQDEALRLIHGAVRLSMHVVGKDPSQFASQMVGRLLDLRDKPGVTKFVAEMTAAATRPWIRPLLPCFDPPGGPLLRTLEGHNSVHDVAVTPDGKRAVSASWDTLTVWDLATGRELRTLEGHSARVNSVAVTADGKRVVSASDDRTLKVWDLDTGCELRTLEGHSDGVNSVAVTPDGKWAVSASHDKTLKVWDLETGGVLRTLEGHTEWVYGVAVTPDGRRAVSASWDKTLKVWDLETGRALRTLKGHSDHVVGVAATPDGTQAVSASEDHTLRVWDLATGRTVHTLEGHSDKVRGVAVTPDGKWAVSASEDKTLKVWNLETGGALLTLEGHSSGVTGVAVTSDGKRAVSASWDATLKIWDLETGCALRTVEGHDGYSSGVAITSDGRRAVSAVYEGMLEVWDLETGQFVATFYCESTAQSCAFLDAHRIVAGDEGGRVYFLALEEEATLPPSPPAASPDSASSRRLLRGLARLIKFGQPR